jgi:hypothetical protein
VKGDIRGSRKSLRCRFTEVSGAKNLFRREHLLTSCGSYTGIALSSGTLIWPELTFNLDQK